jgi:hypothetical protein
LLNSPLRQTALCKKPWALTRENENPAVMPLPPVPGWMISFSRTGETSKYLVFSVKTLRASDCDLNNPLQLTPISLRLSPSGPALTAAAKDLADCDQIEPFRRAALREKRQEKSFLFFRLKS